MSQDPMNAWLQFQQQLAGNWLQAVQGGGRETSAASRDGFPGAFGFGAAPFQFPQWLSGGGLFGGGLPGGGLGMGLDPRQLTWQLLRDAASSAQGKDPGQWKAFAEERIDEVRRYWEDAMGGLRAAATQWSSMREFAALGSPSAMLPFFQFRDWLQALLDPAQAWGGGASELPGLGPHRNQQEAAQEVVRLSGELRKTMLEFNLYMAEGIPEVLDRLRDRLSTFDVDAENPLKSSRAVYDLCVECFEEVYARRTAEESFSRLYGELNNSLLRLRKHWLGQLNEMLRGLGMPDQEALTTLQKRQQELRRELRKLQGELQTLREAGSAPKQQQAKQQKGVRQPEKQAASGAKARKAGGRKGRARRRGGAASGTTTPGASPGNTSGGA